MFVINLVNLFVCIHDLNESGIALRISSFDSVVPGLVFDKYIKFISDMKSIISFISM